MHASDVRGIAVNIFSSLVAVGVQRAVIPRETQFVCVQGVPCGTPAYQSAFIATW